MRVGGVRFGRLALAVAASSVALATLGGATAAARSSAPARQADAGTQGTHGTGTQRAAAGPSFKVTIFPRFTTAGMQTTFTVTVENTSTDGSVLGTVQVAPPTGFKVTHADPTTTGRHKISVHKRRTVSVQTAIKPGGTMAPIRVTATAPNECGTRAVERWTSQASAGSTISSGVQLALQKATSEVGVIVVCPKPKVCGAGNPTCSNTEMSDVSTYTASSDATSGTLIGGLDVGKRLRCNSKPPADPNWYDSMVTGGPASVGYQIQYTLEHTPPSAVHVCLGLPYLFTTATNSPARDARLPNDDSGFIGFAPACPPAPAVPTGPCVMPITTSPDPHTKGVDSNVVVQIPPPPVGAPAGDPWFGG